MNLGDDSVSFNEVHMWNEARNRSTGLSLFVCKHVISSLRVDEGIHFVDVEYLHVYVYAYITYT